MRKESTVATNNNDIPSIMNSAHTEASNVIGFVNSRKSGLNPKDITADPVTHDEFAMYFKCGMDMLESKFTALQKKNEETINVLNDAVEKITKSFSLLNEGIASLHNDSNKASDTNRDLLKTICDTIAKNNISSSSPMSGIIPNSYNSDYAEALAKWVSLTWEELRLIGERSGQDKKAVLREVYALMRSNGIKLDSLFFDYKIRHPQNPKYINMISESEYLRGEFDKYVRVIGQKYFPKSFSTTKTKRHTSNNYVYNVTPPEILAGMEKYKQRHSIRTNRGCAHSIAKQMNKVGNINMAALRREKANELHYSNVCFGYLVNSSEDLKRIFDDVVENW